VELRKPNQQLCDEPATPRASVLRLLRLIDPSSEKETRERPAQIGGFVMTRKDNLENFRNIAYEYSRRIQVR
jgi:hypothetical protein